MYLFMSQNISAKYCNDFKNVKRKGICKWIDLALFY